MLALTASENTWLAGIVPVFLIGLGWLIKMVFDLKAQIMVLRTEMADVKDALGIGKRMSDVRSDPRQPKGGGGE